MIVFHLTHRASRRLDYPSWVDHKFTNAVRKFTGSMKEWRKTKPRKIKATIFDDNHTPPRVLRLEVPFETIERAGYKLPPFMKDWTGDIIETCSGKVVMFGSEAPC